jgi:hypothetical protein
MFLGNAGYVQGQIMTISSGKTLNIVDDPVSEQNAANKAYVDKKAKDVQDALDLVTAGSGVDFNTLLELKNLADSVKASGTLDLTSAIDTEKSRAKAAELALTNNLATEASAARAAELRLQTMNVSSTTAVLYVPAVYADSSSLPTPLERCNYASNVNASIFDGWRMRNAVQGNKFNLYLPLISGPKITVYRPSDTLQTTPIILSTTGLKIKDVKAMYLETCIISTVSRPFLTFYTVPKKDGNDESWWYRSRHTYINNNVSVADTKYNMVANLKNITNINSSNFLTQQYLSLDTYSSKRTDITTDEDDILSFAVSSDSSSSPGNVECIINKFNIQLDNGIHEFVFSNTHIFTDYMKRKQSQLWNTLYGTSSSDDPFLNDFQIPTRTFS